MFKIIIKDLKLFFKNKRDVLLNFALPIALISLFAMAFGGTGGDDDEDRKIPVLIADEDHSKESIETVKKLDQLKGIQLTPSSLKSAQESIKKGDESFVLVLGKGFADSVGNGNELPIELQYDQAKEMEVGLLQQSLIPTLATLSYEIGDPKILMSKRFSKMIGNSSDSSKLGVQLQSDKLYEAIAQGFAENDNEDGDLDEKSANSNFMGAEIKMTPLIQTESNVNLGLIQALAGTSVMMLLFSVAGIGGSLIDEKQEGTLKRLLYSPIHPLSILFGKMICANIISILQMTVMIAFSWLVFGLEISTHIPSLILLIVATSFAASAFGVFVASIAKSRSQVQGLSTLIILVMSAIGGSMIPLFIMPNIMQKIAVVSMNYWSIQGFFDIFWRELSVFDLTFLSRIGVLIFIGILLNCIAIVLFKRSLKRGI